MAESKRKNANAESSEDSENPENSELEVMREKIRKLEADLAMKEKELMSYQIDHLEAKENEVVDIILVFMNNNGFKGIADKILSFLDCKSFVQCRLVCRSWKKFIEEDLLKFMIDHHHHQELEMFLKKQNQKLCYNEKVTDVLATAFNYAQQNGCEICVKQFY